MSASTDLRALLLADATLVGLVSQRISADRIEQNAIRPFVVFARTAHARDKTLDGTVVSDMSTFDVQVWADTRAACESVAEAIRRVIEAADMDVANSADLSDPDLDWEGESLTVDWWQDV